MAKLKNPCTQPLYPTATFDPPASLVRPRNRECAGDALGIDKISGHDGGGKVRRTFHSYNPPAESHRGVSIQ